MICCCNPHDPANRQERDLPAMTPMEGKPVRSRDLRRGHGRRASARGSREALGRSPARHGRTPAWMSVPHRSGYGRFPAVSTGRLARSGERVRLSPGGMTCHRRGDDHAIPSATGPRMAAATLRSSTICFQSSNSAAFRKIAPAIPMRSRATKREPRRTGRLGPGWIVTHPPLSGHVAGCK